MIDPLYNYICFVGHSMLCWLQIIQFSPHWDDQFCQYLKMIILSLEGSSAMDYLSNVLLPWHFVWHIMLCWLQIIQFSPHWDDQFCQYLKNGNFEFGRKQCHGLVFQCPFTLPHRYILFIDLIYMFISFVWRIMLCWLQIIQFSPHWDG